MAIVVLNAVLGVVQESRAEQALAALRKLAAPEAQALRDGRRVSLPAPQLVPAASCQRISACWRLSTCGWMRRL